MRGFASRTVGWLAAGLLLGSVPVVNAAGLSLPVTGNLFGVVVDGRNVPQMGANIQLFDRLGRLRGQSSTLADGRFGFGGLPSDLYSVRVTLSSFLPAVSDRISVRPGVDSILQIHLATLLSTVELRYSVPTGAMSNDWKWVLRSSAATRPITRYRNVSVANEAREHTRVFTDTHANVTVGGGDASFLNADGTAAGYGATFALSTNVFGKNQIRFGGLVGETASPYPGALSLSAFYSRADSGPAPSPEFAVSITQLGVVNGAPANAAGLPQIRTMSMSMYQAMDIGGDAHFEFGATADSVGIPEWTTRSSPFARLTKPIGSAADVVASFSDGVRPDPLLAHQNAGAYDGSETAAVTPLPQISYRNGRVEMERSFSYEAGLRRVRSRYALAVSGFEEHVSNGRVDVAGDRSLLNPLNLMSDGISETSIYNIGRFDRRGIMASADAKIAPVLDASVSIARLGAFSADAASAATLLRQTSVNTVDTSLGAKLPKCGTKIQTSYGWVNNPAIIPQHIFTTQTNQLSPGLNISFRQPLPSLFGMPGHLELRADLRNLLAQGYLPVDGQNGKNLLIVQAPRAVRGGVNFTF